jgi:hypothetical protein
MTISRLMLATALFGSLALPALAATHHAPRHLAAGHVTPKPVLKVPAAATPALPAR